MRTLFWQPSGAVGFKALEPGGIFLFKLHSPRNFTLAITKTRSKQ